jgi:multiple antibiotic resistance protein
MELITIIQTSLYFLALINPASKVFILSSVNPPYSKSELLKISAKSSFVALVILLVLTGLGIWILKSIFQVEIYSLKIAGGIVLFIVGLTAVRKGRFYEQNVQDAISDISIVPLAAPLIAGPGTITGAISYSSAHGIPITMISLTIAVTVNFLIMLSSIWIGKTLEKLHVFEPLIRITGLIVAAVAVQMILGGLSDWITLTIANVKSH